MPFWIDVLLYKWHFFFSILTDSFTVLIINTSNLVYRETETELLYLFKNELFKMMSRVLASMMLSTFHLLYRQLMAVIFDQVICVRMV